MSEWRQSMGRDLKLKFDQLGADLVIDREGDLDTISNEDNLAQAIIARLSTDIGELTDIGHADYGSRLQDLMGEINDAATRGRIRLLVQDCLAQELRIKQVSSIEVRPDPRDLHYVDIEITVLPTLGNKLLRVVYPFHLEVP